MRISLQSYGRVGFGRPVEAVSGADGRFVLSRLETGRFTLHASPLSEPWRQGGAVSVRMGDRDITADGFEVPYSGSEPLRVHIDCSSSGRLR